MSTSDVVRQVDGPGSIPRTSHPTPASLGRHSGSTLSMRNKKQLKRQANAHHSSNFHAGYVPVTEDVLHRSGIRGRKRYFLYCTIAVVMCLAIVNIAVTVLLVYLLGMTHEGVASLETINVATRSICHVFSTTFASIFLLNGVPLGSNHGSKMSVISRDSPINIRSFSSSKFSPSILMNESSITVMADDMRIRSNGSDKWTSLNVQSLAQLQSISNYLVHGLTTRKIQNYKYVNDLYLESPLKQVKVNGSKGVDVESMRDIDVTARNIIVQSENSIVFESKHSVYLDPNLPQTTSASDTRSRSRPVAKKICVCGNGRLFLVPGNSKMSCHISKETAKFVCLSQQ